MILTIMQPSNCNHKSVDGKTMVSGHFQLICQACGHVIKDDPRILVEPLRYESLTKIEQEQNEIVEYLRDQYKQEIARGDHSGMSFPAVIMKYLARERRRKGWLGIFS